ncbi:hypothetical protein SAMN05216490_2879 [Mucilaginibacter mallensis]|uniref:Uncharacterized protein n=1 Tax=Mucilaginibacter mallensis TaxID=652787 RepID=A0A1H1YY54_MUCMA|nr:hypothetical protein [Mucilaginibacter mallensis]SDT25856.1 hypothetical protein SAMN05216490_2879 [Mucilaginibacter mallensis]
MEHEIIGHTKKAIKVMKSHDKPFKEKTKEIIIEILIIVFAVSFAALIERTREHYKEKAEAKEFLIGLKGDLRDEINMLQQSKKDMDSTRSNYTMVMKLKGSDVDSLENTHIKRSFNIASFNTRIVNGRYDGFKSSGKIQTIENDSLRNDILEFYQQDLPTLDFTENAFNDNQKRLTDLLINNSDVMGDKPVDIIRLLASYRGKLILQFAIGYSKSVASNYDQCLEQAKKIKAEIESEYQ